MHASNLHFFEYQEGLVKQTRQVQKRKKNSRGCKDLLCQRTPCPLCHTPVFALFVVRQLAQALSYPAANERPIGQSYFIRGNQDRLLSLTALQLEQRQKLQVNVTMLN